MSTCWLSQCSRCCGLGVVFRMLIWGNGHLEHVDKGVHPDFAGDRAMVTLASRYPGETDMLKQALGQLLTTR
jgi:hypothetical protein